MRIEEEIKLDYSDVLFRPKRSTLKSRKEVDLTRTYKFKHSNREWSGIPIIASNMDGVGELGVANSLSKFKIITALTKQHNLDSINAYKSIKENSKGPGVLQLKIINYQNILIPMFIVSVFLIIHNS